MAKQSSLMVMFYVSGMLLFGSLNTITTKIQFTMKSIGIDGHEKLFKFPWFATLGMFVGMFLALVAKQLGLLLRKKPEVFLRDTSPGGLLDAEKRQAGGISYTKKVILTSIPSFFDLLATGLCAVGMLYIPASVWQMLRGCEILFAAIIAVTFLNRRLYGFNYAGLLLCIIGVTCVSLSNVWAGAAKSEAGVDQAHQILGMAMVVLGQVVQAAQVVAEEYLLTEVDLPEIEVIGYEGMWGMLQMILVVYPIVFILPGDDNGHVEDFFDSFTMICNNPFLGVMVCTYIFSCATYNVFGIAITGALSAVHRAILEASRTSVIWVFGLVMYYGFAQPLTPRGFGEKLNDYSWMQLLGFVLLILGQAIYGEILKLPFLYYPKSEVSMEHVASPGALKSMHSPLPRQRQSDDGASSPSEMRMRTLSPKCN